MPLVIDKYYMLRYWGGGDAFFNDVFCLYGIFPGLFHYTLLSKYIRTEGGG